MEKIDIWGKNLRKKKIKKTREKNETRKRMAFEGQTIKMQTVLLDNKKYQLFHPFEILEELEKFQKEKPNFKVIIMGNEKIEVEIDKLSFPQAETNKKQKIDEWKEEKYLKVLYSNHPYILKTPVRASLFDIWVRTVPNELVVISKEDGTGYKTVKLYELTLNSY